MYKKIRERREYLSGLCEGKWEDKKDCPIVNLAMQEMYCIDVFEETSYRNYEFIRDFAKENNIKKVYDIGCAYGFQSEVFRIAGIDYEGIEGSRIKGFFNKDVFRYTEGMYPEEIRLEGKSDELAVSVLCLTWNCYLYEDDTLHKQLTALKEDFEKVLLYTSLNEKDLEKYFGKVERLDNNFIYLERGIS